MFPLLFVFSKNRKNPAPETVSGGQEPILPAVLEFPETHQDIFLNQVITELDFNMPNFKLAPVYTLYLCARYVFPVDVNFLPSIFL